jgi:hypothetical protein
MFTTARKNRAQFGRTTTARESRPIRASQQCVYALHGPVVNPPSPRQRRVVPRVRPDARWARAEGLSLAGYARPMRTRRPLLASLLVAGCGGTGAPPAAHLRAFPSLHRPLVAAQADGGSLAELHDRLAESLHGEALTEHFLEAAAARRARHQQGADVVVTALTYEAVNVLKNTDHTTTLSATWVVTGSVTHQGHAHSRTNRYRARYAVAETAVGTRIIAEHPAHAERLPGPLPDRPDGTLVEPRRTVLDLLGDGLE